MSNQEVLVPDIGDDEVEVIELCVSPGDSVEADDSLVTVESDKASMDIPAPFAGVVESLNVVVGDKISQGQLLAMISAAESAESAPAQPAEAAPVPAETTPAEPASEESVVKNQLCWSQFLISVTPVT